MTLGCNLTPENALNYRQQLPRRSFRCHCTHRVVVQHELDSAELHQLPHTAVCERPASQGENTESCAGALASRGDRLAKHQII